MKRILTLAAVLVAALTLAGAADAKGRPITSGSGKTKLTLKASNTYTSVSTATALGTECGNPYDMQLDTSLYTTVCFVGCTVGAYAQPWGVVTARFNEEIANFEAELGCTDWYYWT